MLDQEGSWRVPDLSTPVGRSPMTIWRDSATAAGHAVVSPQVSCEVYGKALLAVQDTITPLV